MAEIMAALGKNIVLMTALTAWSTAQVLKVITAFVTHRRFRAERIVGAGGMPSSHTSLVVSLAAAVWFHDGLESPLFAVSAVLAGIVMYDAAGIRRAAGKQAKVINKLIREMRVEHKFNEARLKELLGHTPLEVLAGALLGLFIARLFSQLY